MNRTGTAEMLEVTLIDEKMEVGLGELCRACAVDAEQILEMVEIGLLTPRGGCAATWRFSGVSICRVQTALRLHRDLQVNLAGAALALELLEEVRSLRRRLGRVG